MEKFCYLKPMGILSGLISAVLLTCSGPGFDVPLLNFIAFVPLLYYIRKHPVKWLIPSLSFGIVYYCINLFWITEAVNYFGDANIFISLLLLLLLSLYMTIYYIVFAYLYTKTNSVLIIALSFSLLEVVKSFFLSGFPWLNLGLTSTGYRPLLMNAALIGEIGIGFVVMLSNLLIVEMLTNWKKNLVYLISLFILIHAYYFYKNVNINGKEVSFAVVQPSYDQKKKWEPSERKNVINEVLAYTDKAYASGSDIVVLSESAFPVYIQFEKDLLTYFFTKSDKKSFIVGNMRFQLSDKGPKIYNSNFFFQKGNMDFYDKIHLVPFGEYFPMKFITGGIQKHFFGSNSDFSPGESIKIFSYKDANIGNLICYEDAFFELPRKNVLQGANILVVTTNDSWFGKSLGRIQHFSMDIMRSVETGRSIIRSSQSGISGCIKPYGVIAATMDIGVKGVLECKVPINEEKTIFVRFGYWWLAILTLISSATYFYRKKKLIKNTSS